MKKTKRDLAVQAIKALGSEATFEDVRDYMSERNQTVERTTFFAARRFVREGVLPSKKKKGVPPHVALCVNKAELIRDFFRQNGVHQKPAVVLKFLKSKGLQSDFSYIRKQRRLVKESLPLKPPSGLVDLGKPKVKPDALEQLKLFKRFCSDNDINVDDAILCLQTLKEIQLS